VVDFLEIGSCKLFSQAGFKLLPFWHDKHCHTRLRVLPKQKKKKKGEKEMETLEIQISLSQIKNTVKSHFIPAHWKTEIQDLKTK
jgi:hypothetical protein